MGKVRTGVASRWNDERGFGFIKAHDGGPDIFAHRSQLPGGDDRSARLEEGDEVEFEEIEQKGKMCAGKIEILSGGGGGRRGGDRKDSRDRGRGGGGGGRRGGRRSDSRDDSR